MFYSLLEQFGFNQNSTRQALIEHAVKYVKYWTFIFGAEGKHKKLLEEHDVYLSMKKTYVDLYKNLRENQFGYKFLQELSGIRKQLNEVFLLIVRDSKFQTQEALKTALNLAARACTDIKQIQSVCLKLSSFCSPYTDCLAECEQCMKNTLDEFENGKLVINDIINQGIFKRGDKDLEKSILNSCKELEKVITIDAFSKSIDVHILKKRIQTYKKLPREKGTQVLLRFISAHCISKFKDIMTRVLDGTIQISELFFLFWQEDLTNEHLTEELNNIALVMGMPKFPDERKAEMIRCLNLNLNIKKFVALKNFQSDVCSSLKDEVKRKMEDFEEMKNNRANCSWSMSEANSLISDMESSLLDFSEDVMGVFIEYSNAKDLIMFLKVNVDEDIRNLMDAVEGEYFDQYLPLISNLIKTKELLFPIISLPKGTDTVEYISVIEKGLSNTKINNPTETIKFCRKELSSIKKFYEYFANKTEKTKDQIENIIENGTFCFKLNEMECSVEIICKDDTKYIASYLSGLRSRALLIQSKFDQKHMSNKLADNLRFFVENIDSATDVFETYKRLKMLGHPSFIDINSKVEMCKLKEKQDELDVTCHVWSETLEKYRQKYLCLKYIKTEQLPLFFNFTKKLHKAEKVKCDISNVDDLQSVLWYLHPKLRLSLTEKTNDPENDSPSQNLDMVVRLLEDNFKVLEPRGNAWQPPVKVDKLTLKTSKKINFICLDKDSWRGLHVILGWFMIKCKPLPLPSQIVLCNENTSWDELYLLLLRSREQDSALDKCFCIAFLELLPVEYQDMLIKEIENNDKCNASLSLIYRGRSTDPIPTVFKEYGILEQKISDIDMRQSLKEMFEDVMVFTSDSPGLGKTERIWDLAASHSKSVKRLHISGAVHKYKLIQLLKELDLKPYEILHIDIGLCEKPDELDAFLFELIILRYVSSATLSYVMPQTRIALEIANCPNNMMTNSLPFTMYFSRTHLKWDDYNNYRCQLVLNSPIQVSCAYLSKLDEGDLTTDIDLTRTALLNEKKCQSLLRKYFPYFHGINFTIVDAFVSVLSNQLKRFSASTFFQSANLNLMIGQENTFAVRKIILESLIKFSEECASKSFASPRYIQNRLLEQSVDLKNIVMNLATRTEKMIKWENSNHLIVVFHNQNTQTVSVVYRSLKDVPDTIKNMFHSQIRSCLPDYTEMESDRILEVIVKLTRTKQIQLSKGLISKLAQGYAYTPDNMLKLLMIAQRIQSNIPVVIMGETGCGKTSLIKKLAKLCDVQLQILNVHAGIREKDILDTVHDANNSAIEKRSQEVWFFFDELNTSEYVGLISDIVCNRKLHGHALSPNISFIAACNPYRRRESNSYTNGLIYRQSKDALSLLAYRVHPLPEKMLDFVWDYGSLSHEEEETYIQRMIEADTFGPHKQVLIKLLGSSQNFVREKEGLSCTVSLRDINRCILLIKWFKDTFIPEKSKKDTETEIFPRPFILGLTICYMCRLPNPEDRLAYREKIAAIISSHISESYSEEHIAKCVVKEQEYILESMDIPKGIAKNAALKENVFVLLVCILNKLPLFIVGKPGCSKSLSMQLIKNSMKGKDSKHQFFQRYPRLIYLSFQGSESSTSDGITKVFERTIKLEKQNSDSLALVILDEIGLAEISRFNPLKVLHSLLEPEEGDRPEVAVVGISNWSLDPAKMNRAIYLSRSDMNENELVITGQAIMEQAGGKERLEKVLQNIARSFLEYTNQQPIKHFHGLRDFYSFVRYISREFEKMENKVIVDDTSEKMSQLSDPNEIMPIFKGLLRNFGGQTKNNTAMKTFTDRIIRLKDLPIIETKELIKENILDIESRHLMIILDEDSAVSSIESIIEDLGKDFTTLIGSKFADDEDDQYNYRVLNRIILCMEQPHVLILKDLDDIYGSLYDMLNQNYSIVQGKKHCRVALGPYSNPTCEVNSDFKCIVIKDKSEIETTDPPFLNRFEKQLYVLRDILKPHHSELVGCLEKLFSDFSSYSERNVFDVKDAFPFAGEDIFISLVTLVEQKLKKVHKKSPSETHIMYYCIIELLWILKPDCILRAETSNAYKKSKVSMEFLIAMYMNLPIHEGLVFFLQKISAAGEVNCLTPNDISRENKHIFGYVPLQLKEIRDTYFRNIKDNFIFHEIPDSKQIESKQMQILRRSDNFGARVIVFTYSSVYCKISEDWSEANCFVSKLAYYKTEKSFTKDVEGFFGKSKKEWYVLQCDIKSDYHNILLAKSIIESTRKRFGTGGTHHVCIVVHVARDNTPSEIFSKINFSTGWTLATLDSIEKPELSLPYLYKEKVLDVLEKKLKFGELIDEELDWASARFQYQGSLDNFAEIIELRKSKCAKIFISEQLKAWIKRHNNSEDGIKDWQHKAACDKHLLETSTTMICTLKNYLLSLIRNTLSRILFSCEKVGIMSCLISMEKLKPEFKALLLKGCECQSVFNIDDVPTPTGPGCYLINLKHGRMKVPFSKLIFEIFEKYKDIVLKDVEREKLMPGDLEVEDKQELNVTMQAIAKTNSSLIKSENCLFVYVTFDHVIDDLRHDFCHIATSSIKCWLTLEKKIDLMNVILGHFIRGCENGEDILFLTTLHLWKWTYFTNIIVIFKLIDSWKNHDKYLEALSILRSGSDNGNTILESLNSLIDFILEDILIQVLALNDSDMIKWRDRAFKIITIISEIDVSSHKIETLKFFSDFVSVILTSSKCNLFYLKQIASSVSSCNWDLNNLSVFEQLWNVLKSQNESLGFLELQKTVCSFIARCNMIHSGDDSQQSSINLRLIHLIENGEMIDNRLKIFYHCLKVILISYQMRDSSKLPVYLKMLENGRGSVKLNHVLHAVDKLLCKKDVPTFSSLFTTIVEENELGDLNGIEDMAQSNDSLIDILFKAQNVFRSQSCGMVYFVAIAYLRKFLSLSASLLFTPSCQKGHLPFVIDQLMHKDLGSKEQKHLQKYFIDCLKRSSGNLEVFKLSIKLSELSTTVPFFRTLSQRMKNIGFSVMSLNLARYCQLSDLLDLQSLKNISNNNSFKDRIMEREETSVASLLCFLHSRLFYVECYSRVADSDRLFVDSLEDAGVCSKNDEVSKLIDHLINQHNCSNPMMKQNEQKTAESTSLTTFLLHVISLILIRKTETSTLYKAAIYHKVSDGTPQRIGPSKTFHKQTCTCSFRSLSSENFKTCLLCSSSDVTRQSVNMFQPFEEEPISAIVRKMLIEAALVTSCLFKNEISEVDAREKSIQRNWKRLREYLQVNDDEQCQILMIFLENVKEIFEDSTISLFSWNPMYDEVLRKVLQSRYQQLRDDNIRHSEVCKGLWTAMDIEKVEDVEDVETDKLFCLSEKPSIQNLYFTLQILNLEERFPILNMILENLELLQFPQHIAGILQWHRLLVTRCSYKLRKVDCKYMSVSSFIDEHTELQTELRDSFKIFSDAWENIVSCISKLEHHTVKLPFVDKITEDSKLDFCVLKDKTSTIFQILHALCSLQNKLLDKVLELCILFESNSLSHLCLEPAQAAFPVVALMDLRKKHIVMSVAVEEGEELELFPLVGCAADTRCNHYDFKKIEMEWANIVFHNRAYILIDETMMFMEFKDNLYGHCVELLNKISAFIPQATIDSTTELKIKEIIKNNPSQGPQLLTLIGTIITIIFRKKTAEKRQNIADYAEKNFARLQLIGLSCDCLKPFVEYDLTLNNVVAFYVLLEAINGEICFRTLQNEFRVDMQNKTKQKITDMVNGKIELLKACESAMHIFLHRYLYTRDNDIRIQQPIADYLKSNELWKDAEILNKRIFLLNLDVVYFLEDVFPQELLIKHTYTFLELIKEQIQVSVVITIKT